MSAAHLSLAQIIGPWQEQDFESELIDRMRTVWNKPIESLTNRELATCFRQKIAIDHLLPLAKRRLADGIADDTEMHDTELADAVAETEYWCRADHEDRRIRGLPPREKTP